MHGKACIAHIDRMIAEFKKASPKKRARMLGLAR